MKPLKDPDTVVIIETTVVVDRVVTNSILEHFYLNKVQNQSDLPRWT